MNLGEGSTIKFGIFFELSTPRPFSRENELAVYHNGLEQCRLADELGFDHAIDYKEEDIGARLKELAPNGVNIFFDNVVGNVLDAVLDNIGM